MKKHNKNKTIKVKSKKSTIPLRNGGHRWNIYRVSNYILNGKRDNDVHGGLVIEEINEKVILVEVTHSSRWGKRNNYKIRNINSKDISSENKLKDSYIKKHLVFSKNGQAISVSVLKKQQNDLNFTIEEIKEILEMINSLDSTKEKYEQFKKFVKKQKKNG